LSIYPNYEKENFQKQINIYKILWFVIVYNFEMDKISKNEQKSNVDSRFPAAERYLNDIKNLLEN